MFHAITIERSVFKENPTNFFDIPLPAEYATVFSGRTDAPEVRCDLTDRQTDRHTHTTKYSNPRCACAPRVNDRNSRGGGVLVAVNDSIPSSLVYSPSNVEIVCVQIELTCPFHLCTVYVPPNSDLSYLKSVIDFFTVNILSSCIIVGDFNLPNICWSSLTGSSAIGASFREFVFNWNLTQHLSVSTHIKGNILDLVLTSDNIQISDLSSNHPGSIINSDHILISFNLNYEGPQSVVNKFRYVCSELYKGRLGWSLFSPS